MFKKSETPSGQTLDTLIGKKSKFEGKLIADGVIRIEGEFVGDILVTGDVIIGIEGKVVGDISSENVIVSGSIEGNVTASNQLQLNSTGKIIGDLNASSLVIEDKAIFEGKCTMRNKFKDSNEENA